MVFQSRVPTVEMLESRHLLDVTLVKDIDTITNSSYPTQLTSFGDFGYFVAHSDQAGRGHPYNELWRTDGTAEGTVQFGSEFDFPSIGKLTKVGRALFFVTEGPVLWTTDGTVEGTKSLYDWSDTHLSIRSVHGGDNGVYIRLNDRPGRPNQLWWSDGSNTHRIATLELISLVVPTRLRVFVIESTREYHAVYVSNNEPNGLVKLSEFSRISDAVRREDNLVFEVNGEEGSEVWESDGTELGTQMVSKADIVSGLANLKGQILFHTTVNDESALWVWDGIRTQQIASDIGSYRYFSILKDKLYFSARSGSRYELWETDGTPGGTQFVSKVGTQQELATVGEYLFFWNSVNPIISDGTAQGTLEFREVFPNSELQSLLPYPILVNGKMIFRGTDSDGDTELWMASEGSSRLLKNVFSTGSRGSDPSNLFFSDDKIYFAVGSQLWVSRGREENTHAVPAPPITLNVQRGGEPILIGAIQGKAIFAHSPNDSVSFPGPSWGTQSLWASDGTEPGTTEISQEFPRGDSDTGPREPIGPAIQLGGQLFFLVARYEGVDFYSIAPLEIWVTDGTKQGTKKFTPSNLEDVRAIRKVGDKLYIRTRNGVWESDGTTDGTHQILDIGQTRYAIRSIQLIGDRLFAVSDLIGGGTRLWIARLDGKQLVRSVDLPIRSRALDVAGEHLALSTANYGELWAYDVSADKLNSIVNTRVPIEIIDSTANGLVYASPEEIWSTDGTIEGTKRLAEVRVNRILSDHSPGLPYSSQYFARIGDRIYFHGYRNGEGSLWETDGTAANTRPLSNSKLLDAQEIEPGPNGTLLLAADDGVFGNELRVFELPVVSIPGDANGDGKVTFIDFLALSTNFQATDATWAMGDFDEDGIVNFTDFLLLAQNFAN